MMQRFALAFGFAVVGLAQPPLVIPQIADGGGWTTTIVLLNNFTLNSARVEVTFRGGDGRKLAFPLQNYGAVNTMELELGSQTSTYLETAGLNPVPQVGSVQVNQLSGGSPVKAFAIFRQVVPGRPDFEAIAPGMRPADFFTFPFDNTNGSTTSFAVVSLSLSGCAVSVSAIFDETGVQLTSGPKLLVDLNNNGHTAFASTDRLPEMASRRGHLTFAVPPLGCAPGGLAILGLRFNATGPFTNLLPLSAFSNN